MKRNKIFKIIIILLLVLIPFISWFSWSLEETRKLKVLILDKTVLNKDSQEHLSLNWILNHEKYGDDSLDLYEPKEDYFGFFPDGKGLYEIVDFNNYSNSQLDSLSESYDMVYYTDLYGIYHAEWFETYPDVAPEDYIKIEMSERSRLIYGGMSPKELRLLKQMKDQKKLIITEFNSIAYPTSYNVRTDFEKEFGIKWSNWVGRYFESLDTNENKDLPRWLKQNYIEQTNNWPFSKSGIVFVRTDDWIVILENENQLENETPIIITTKLQRDIYNLPNEMKYPFWFDISSIDNSNMLVSYYEIRANQQGDSILKVNGIPNTFPAVIKSKGDSPFYYFAGDFADNPITMRSSRFNKVEWVSSLTYESSAHERSSFFWDFYRPLMITILDSYYSSDKMK